MTSVLIPLVSPREKQPVLATHSQELTPSSVTHRLLHTHSLSAWPAARQ
jgi:hypothetical protein